MRQFRGVLIVVALLCATAAILLWNLRKPNESPSPEPPTEPAIAETSPPEPEIPLTPVPAVPAPRPEMPPQGVRPPQPLTAPDATALPPANTAESQIDQIILSDTLSDADKSKRLLDLLPLLPQGLQAEAAQHMCNLLPDDSYGMVGPLLTNGLAPEHIMDVVIADIYGRPNRLKLPMMFQIARNEQHPRHEEAMAILEIYLEQDLGSDWAAWERSLQKWLKENPE